MSPKNIDETIQKLLQGYTKWCGIVLGKEYKNLQKRKFKTAQEQEKAQEDYKRKVEAYNFLQEIANNPKQYLYSGEDLIYTKGDLYNKLSPVLWAPFDKSGNNLLIRLSEKIAYHVKYGKNDHNGVWVYYGNSGYVDLEAESVLKMNKAVQLWKANDFVAALKDIAPDSVYAVDLYKNGKEK